jgi:hypothetical protein
LLDYSEVWGIRFTLGFGKAITIAAMVPGHEPARAGQAFRDFRESGPRRRQCVGLRNEGVGEHVRTKSQLAKSAGEIADLWIRTDEENFFLLPSRFSKRASPVENDGPAV